MLAKRVLLASVLRTISWIYSCRKFVQPLDRENPERSAETMAAPEPANRSFFRGGFLFDRGYEFDFFQAVRLLQRMYPHGWTPGRTARPPTGELRAFGARLSWRSRKRRARIRSRPDSADRAQ